MNERKIPTKVKVEKKVKAEETIFSKPAVVPAELAVVEKEEEVEEEEVETKEEQFLEIRNQAKDLKEKTAKLFWDFAVILSDIQSRDLFRVWGYNTWGDYIDQELEIGKRAVQKYIRVYDWFKVMPENIQEWIKSIGWTKAQHLVEVVKPENAGEWRNRIAGLTVGQIEQLIHDLTHGTTEGDEEGSGSSSEPDTGERPKAKKFNLMPDQYDTVELALQRASEISESDKENHNLTMICMEYVSSNTHIKNIDDYLKQVEKALGVLLIAYREEEGEYVTVAGQHHFDTIDPQ